MPYGQEGRQAVVYLIESDDGTRQALKAFKSRFRVPALVTQAGLLVQYASLRGLRVCERTVLSPRKHADLLAQEPDLVYAVVMPWIEGPTWMQVMLDKRPITAD